jgi:hypothetical protein
MIRGPSAAACEPKGSQGLRVYGGIQPTLLGQISENSDTWCHHGWFEFNCAREYELNPRSRTPRWSHSSRSTLSQFSRSEITPIPNLESDHARHRCAITKKLGNGYQTWVTSFGHTGCQRWCTSSDRTTAHFRTSSRKYLFVALTMARIWGQRTIS